VEVWTEGYRLAPEIEDDSTMEPAPGEICQCLESLEVLGSRGLGGSHLDAHHVAVPLEDEIHLGSLGCPKVEDLRGIRVPGRLFEQLEPDEVLANVWASVDFPAWREPTRSTTGVSRRAAATVSVMCRRSMGIFYPLYG
jgi:hypothetical protein